MEWATWSRLVMAESNRLVSAGGGKLAPGGGEAIRPGLEIAQMEMRQFFQGRLVGALLDEVLQPLQGVGGRILLPFQVNRSGQRLHFNRRRRRRRQIVGIGLKGFGGLVGALEDFSAQKPGGGALFRAGLRRESEQIGAAGDASSSRPSSRINPAQQILALPLQPQAQAIGVDLAQNHFRRLVLLLRQVGLDQQKISVHHIRVAWPAFDGRLEHAVRPGQERDQAGPVRQLGERPRLDQSRAQRQGRSGGEVLQQKGAPLDGVGVLPVSKISPGHPINEIRGQLSGVRHFPPEQFHRRRVVGQLEAGAGQVKDGVGAQRGVGVGDDKIVEGALRRDEHPAGEHIGRPAVVQEFLTALRRRGRRAGQRHGQKKGRQRFGNIKVQSSGGKTRCPGCEDPRIPALPMMRQAGTRFDSNFFVF